MIISIFLIFDSKFARLNESIFYLYLCARADNTYTRIDDLTKLLVREYTRIE